MKYFNVFNSISTDVDLEGMFEVNDIQDVYAIIEKHWGLQPSQVKFKYKFEYKEHTPFYDVMLCNRLGVVFAIIGDVNFNPY